MKANGLKFKLLLLILSVGFSSCDKEESLISDNSDSSEKFRLLKVLNYSDSSASNLTGETVYEYDETGNVVKETVFLSWNSELHIQSYYEYEYSGNKKVKEKLFYRNVFPTGNLNFNHYVDYFYDGDLLVKTERYSGGGSFSYSEHYKYDTKGNLVENYSYDPSWIGKGVWGGIYDTGIYGHKKYVYDNQNRLITELTSDGVVDFYPCRKYTYNNDGKVAKIEYLEYEGLSGYDENVYNNRKMLELVFSYDKNGNQNRKVQHYYDGLGNLTESKINDECSIFKRQYDGKLLIEEIHYWAHEYGYHFWGQAPESGMSRYEYEEF